MKTRLAVTSIEKSSSGETWLRVRVPARVTVPSIFDNTWSVTLETNEEPAAPEPDIIVDERLMEVNEFYHFGGGNITRARDWNKS